MRRRTCLLEDALEVVVHDHRLEGLIVEDLAEDVGLSSMRSTMDLMKRSAKTRRKLSMGLARACDERSRGPQRPTEPAFHASGG